MMKKHLLKAILLTAFVASPFAAHADVAISVGFAPPALPVYEQPPMPGQGYMWTPGYWAWNPEIGNYYWVPGSWVMAPFVGALWTPGYWGWVGGNYLWHGGYWGTHIGYYGGINYGFGYVGIGYQGGYWSHGAWAYNRAVNNFGGVHVTNVYNSTVHVNNVTRVSYNGGTGGIQAQPTREQMQKFTHYAPTGSQVNHEQLARAQPQMRASNNGATPAGASQGMSRFNGSPSNNGPQRYATSQSQPAASNRPGQPEPAAQHTQAMPTPNYRTSNPAPARQVSARPQSAPPQHYSYSQPTMMHSEPSRSSSSGRSYSAPQHSSSMQHSRSHR